MHALRYFEVEVVTLRIILYGLATTTSGVVKWYGSIATHGNLTKTLAKSIIS